MPRRRLQKLTISLLKTDLQRADALRESDDIDPHIVPTFDRDEPSLFTASTPARPPAWLRYLVDHTEDDLKHLRSASCSAVVLFEAADRLFAVTWGHGRHLLQRDAFEQDFGLKVVVNTVAPDQLKSVDARTIEETTVHTRRDLSRDSALSAFGLDISRDLLRAVTGSPVDQTLAHRLSGADALGMHTYAQLDDLPDLAERLLEAYESTAYREHFDFIDHLRPEKRAFRVQQLDEILVRALDMRQIDDAHLAVPETMDWIDVDGFRFSTSQAGDEPTPDPRISAYLDSRAGEDLTIDMVKADRLIARRASTGGILDDWPVYRCLVYQVELDDRLFVLSAGDWFRVDLDYRRQVEADVDALPRFEGLPDADPDTDEDTYNKKAAKHLDAACLDKRFVYDGGPDKMEVCDVLTREGGFIHVKPRGASSTLSHLFSQGLNSAERLLGDAEFRLQARALAKKVDQPFAEVISTTRPDPADHEITFAIITRSDRATPLTLPFFSVVSLRSVARTLTAFGYTVSVAEVREQGARTRRAR
jgi:uncharacterized protein (TIGR04141 family)